MLTDKAKELLVNASKDRTTGVYWDYRDSLSNEQITKIVSGDYDSFYDELYTMNIDYIFELEGELINQIIDKVKDNITKLIGEAPGVWEDDAKEYLRECGEQYVDLNVKDLIKYTGKVPMRLTLYSNYDCINSHHFEGGYSYEQSYFGDTVDLLQLNPAQLKDHLEEYNIAVYGEWPDYNDREPLVDYEFFVNEVINSSAPANLFTFLVKVDLNSFKNGAPGTILVEEGTPCSFFTSTYGGGSIFECTTLRDWEVNLGQIKGKSTKYDSLELEPDTGDYSFRRVYGVDDEMFQECRILTTMDLEEVTT